MPFALCFYIAPPLQVQLYNRLYNRFAILCSVRRGGLKNRSSLYNPVSAGYLLSLALECAAKTLAQVLKF